MEIAESEIDGVLVLEPQGYIDSTNANAFTTQLMDIVRARRCSLVIDFQNVKYISSAGFRSLLIVGDAIEGMQRKLVLCGIAAEVRRVFAITKFDELFVVCATRSEAADVVK